MRFNTRSFFWVADLQRDLVHAGRLLRRNPLVTVTAVLSLAIGIGANTTVFTVTNALLFQPPRGVAEPSRLVDIGSTRHGGGFGPSSYPDYLDIRQRATAVDGVYAYSRFPQPMSVAGDGTSEAAESVFGNVVTVNYFSVLGAVAAAGRLFGTGDSDHPGASPVVVLGHRFWSRRFNSDRAVIGRALKLDGQLFTVVGVASEGFHGTGIREVDVWVPVGMVTSAAPAPQRLTDRSARWLLIGARMKPGVSISRAAAELSVIGSALEREYVEQNRDIGLAVSGTSPVPGHGGPLVAFLALIGAIVSIVLIIACVNLAGVLLARATARRSEMAVRLAIGAGRGRLVRQLLTETVLLFVLGGIAGVMVARVTTSLLVSRLPALPFPVSLALTLDRRAIAFAIALSLAAALLSGLAPAIEASQPDVVSGLRNVSRRPGRLRLRHAFVIAQVTLSIVLIITAGLFTRALHRAAATDPGFDPEGVELMSIDLAQGAYTDKTGRPFIREVIDRVRLLQGVLGATIASAVPGGFEVRREGLGVPGGSSEGGPGFITVDWNAVEPGYFATLRIPMVAGRDFRADDREGAAQVAIVSESAARQFWPGQNAVGKYPGATHLGPPGADDANAHVDRGGGRARRGVHQRDRWSDAHPRVCPLPAAILAQYHDRCAHDPWPAYS